MSCKTFFHKPADMICYLYNYPSMEYTETFPESGIKVYKMKGCSWPEYDVLREIGVCLKFYETTNSSFTYETTVCKENGGELISLETDLKIDCLSSYLLLQFGRGVAVSVGLDNSAGWKWVNGQPLDISHPNVSVEINEHDRNMAPCDSNYCRILSVSFEIVRIYDNCCNNIKPRFVCSIPFR
ncbi:uncharacterized protein LOC128178790 [Crassostrea angulata]|uniref:uncharacterized protein LOC128178790 n=1 Tax=Magallana angulata TaxID=2784310 RepID=UPI0022B1FFB6|nr:uncharacterized protein LOC128178790 [Crassostrea angulata]